jgi:beta-lactamase class A
MHSGLAAGRSPHSMTRRGAFTRALLAFAAPGVTRSLSFGFENASLEARLAELDKRGGGRLGCAVLDTSTGAVIAHRGGERFPMCSTFKASAVAFVLWRADRRAERLDRRIVYSARDVLPGSPVTKLHVGGDGIPVADLCAAAITVSDNTAANLLLASFGGPAALTNFWRSIGDTVTRLDRMEPELSDGAPGDPRDTTTPAAMLENLHKFVLGDVLAPASREIFTKWLVANTTGDARLRAGLPRDWVIGDKTGTGGHETSNDIAVIWPPDRKPFVVAAYLTQGSASAGARDAILADVGRAVAHEFSATSP